MMISDPADLAENAEQERVAFRDAVRACSQTVPGLFAWGAVTGMAMVQTGLSLWQCLVMTLFVYAGSAQLAALPLIAAGTPVWVVAFTAFMVNLRFVIFSAVIGPHFIHLPWWRRLWMGYNNADMVMGFFPQRYPLHGSGNAAAKLGYFRGLFISNWWGWQLGTLTGVLLASQIPQAWGIGFAGSLALLALTIPMVKNKPTVIGVIVASIVAVAAVGWPYRLGLLLAMLAGIAAAVLTEQARERRMAAS
jgi:predicted branched-subunit amino acid permease